MTVLANAGATAISSGRDRVSVQGMAPARVAELLVASGVRLEELVSAGRRSRRPTSRSRATPRRTRRDGDAA